VAINDAVIAVGIQRSIKLIGEVLIVATVRNENAKLALVR
jgi:hypothetical protein